MPKAHPLFLEVAAALRALAIDSETTWSRYTHAEDEMLDAGFDDNDEVHIYQNGKITEGETEGEHNQRRYRVEGFTTDGIHAVFVVCFSTEEKWLETVTAFRGRE